LASGSFDKTVRFWNIENKKGFIVGKHDDIVMSVFLSFDSKFIVSGSADCSVRFWNIETKENIIIGFHKDLVSSVSLS
jgi:WD40 repeat protein